jgi:hypothetical protein
MNRLEILREIEPRIVLDRKQYKQVEVKCFCGNIFTTLLKRIHTGETKSCGCNRKNRTHGMSKHPLYSVWSGMRSRCYNEKSEGYRNYGLRGIEVCDEWRRDVLSFIDWALNNGYKQNLEIDRINNDENYSPENCRWVTGKINNRNKRTNVLIRHNGRRRTIGEWAERMRIEHRRAYEDFKQLGFLKRKYFTK